MPRHHAPPLPARQPDRPQSATAGRESLYTAAYLGLFPALKDYLQHSTPAGSVPGAPLVVGGIVAGMLGTTLTHPFDTCKTRMQVGPAPGRGPGGCCAMLRAWGCVPGPCM